MITSRYQICPIMPCPSKRLSPGQWPRGMLCNAQYPIQTPKCVSHASLPLCRYLSVLRTDDLADKHFSGPDAISSKSVLALLPERREAIELRSGPGTV